MLRRVLAITLAISLTGVHLPASAQDRVSAEESRAPLTDEEWDALRLIPRGTRVSVTRRQSRATKIWLASVSDSEITSAGAHGRTFRRADVTRVEVVSIAKRYKADGSPNPVIIRKVVAAIGVGRGLEVMTQGQRIHGRIEQIDADGFVVRAVAPRGRDRVSHTISYDDVTSVDGGSGVGVLPIVLVGVGVVVLVSVLDWLSRAGY